MCCDVVISCGVAEEQEEEEEPCISAKYQLPY